MCFVKLPMTDILPKSCDPKSGAMIIVSKFSYSKWFIASGYSDRVRVSLPEKYRVMLFCLLCFRCTGRNPSPFPFPLSEAVSKLRKHFYH